MHTPGQYPGAWSGASPRDLPPDDPPVLGLRVHTESLRVQLSERVSPLKGWYTTYNTHYTIHRMQYTIWDPSTVYSIIYTITYFVQYNYTYKSLTPPSGCAQCDSFVFFAPCWLHMRCTTHMLWPCRMWRMILRAKHTLPLQWYVTQYITCRSYNYQNQW